MTSTQYLVLIRHGDAVKTAQDPDRPLSVDGRRHAESTASRLIGADLPMEEIRHSDKTRARQTAEIVAARLGFSLAGTRTRQGLAPKDDPEPVAREIESEGRSVILVGHMPFLGKLASLLLTGEPERLDLAVADGAAIILSRGGRLWRLHAMFSHEFPPG